MNEETEAPAYGGGGPVKLTQVSYLAGDLNGFVWFSLLPSSLLVPPTLKLYPLKTELSLPFLISFPCTPPGVFAHDPGLRHILSRETAR